MGMADVRVLEGLRELNLKEWPLGQDGGCSSHAARCQFASIPAGPSIFDVSESEQGNTLEQLTGGMYRFGTNE